MQEENKCTPEEAFFKAKSELEQKLVAQLKEFAGTNATSVTFKGCVDIQPLFSETGKIIEARISRVEVETKIIQGRTD